MRLIPKYGTITIDLSLMVPFHPKPGCVLFYIFSGDNGLHPTMINKGAILSITQYLLTICHSSPLPVFPPGPCPGFHRRNRLLPAESTDRKTKISLLLKSRWEKRNRNRMWTPMNARPAKTENIRMVPMILPCRLRLPPSSVLTGLLMLSVPMRWNMWLTPSWTLCGKTRRLSPSLSHTIQMSVRNAGGLTLQEGTPALYSVLSLTLMRRPRRLKGLMLTYLPDTSGLGRQKDSKKPKEAVHGILFPWAASFGFCFILSFYGYFGWFVSSFCCFPFQFPQPASLCLFGLLCS